MKWAEISSQLLRTGWQGQVPRNRVDFALMRIWKRVRGTEIGNRPQRYRGKYVYTDSLLAYRLLGPQELASWPV